MLDKLVVTKITIVNFRAYDKACEEHFIDKEPKQITEFIFRTICFTAVIQSIHEYYIADDGIVEIKNFDKQKK